MMLVGIMLRIMDITQVNVMVVNLKCMLIGIVSM